MDSHHDTFLDVLLEIRHHIFELFDQGFVIHYKYRGSRAYYEIVLNDGTCYEAEYGGDQSIGWDLTQVGDYTHPEE